jgi:hypothetical protein
MANVTLKTGTNQAEVVHAGVNAAVCSISMSATTSSGDVLRIGTLPHQAVVLDAVFYPGAAAPGTLVSKFGVSGSEAALIASASNSSIVRTNVNVTTLNTSRSDDNAQRFTYITCTPTGVISVGNYGRLVVFYKLPGQNVT